MRRSSRRLLLSPIGPDDADELVEVLADRSLYRFTGGRPPQRDELRTRFEGWIDRRSPDGLERWLNWVIRDRGPGRALGTMQASVRAGGAGLVAELAWVLGVDAQGHGYASEASRATVAYLRSKGVSVFLAHIHPDHAASSRVASALGMYPTEEWSEGERAWRLDYFE